MATTINWATKEINISRAGLTLVQSVPNEIRELNLNSFRLDLKDLEDDEEGMAFIRTHNHNTEVLLGGIVYARIVEIINGYTVTFEDGQYAVNLVGANSNVGDVVNLNQVSIRSANAAGLISNSAIEYSSFNGTVTIDVTSGITGTTFPKGTAQAPVNNTTDALLIAGFRGITTIHIIGDITFDTGDDMSHFDIHGEHEESSIITVNPGANVTDSAFSNCTLQGSMDGSTTISHCKILDVSIVSGLIEKSIIGGTLTLDGIGYANIIDCYSGIAGEATPTIDFNGAGSGLIMRNYSGGVELTNKSGTEVSSIDLVSGQVKMTNTFTAGALSIRGVGKLTESSTGDHIKTGTWNTGVAIKNELINYVTIAEATTYHDGVYVDAVNGVSGSNEPIGLERQPVNNLADALAISIERGTRKLIFLSDFTFQATDVVQGYELTGNGYQRETLTFVGGTIVAFCTVSNATITGNFTGIVGITDCYIKDLGSVGLTPSSQDLVIRNCKFGGATTLPSNYSGNISIIDSHSDNAVTAYALFDGGGSSANMLYDNWSGPMQLSNISSNNHIDIRMAQGEIVLNNSVTLAGIHVTGVGELRDSLGNVIPSGTWNTGVSIDNDLHHSHWTETSVQESLAYSKKASDNAEQLNTRI